MSDAPGPEALSDKSEIADAIHADCFHFDRDESEAVVVPLTLDVRVRDGLDVQRQVGATNIKGVYTWHRYRGTDAQSELWAQYHHTVRCTPEGWKPSHLVLRASGTKSFQRETIHPIGRTA